MTLLCNFGLEPAFHAFNAVEPHIACLLAFSACGQIDWSGFYARR